MPKPGSIAIVLCLSAFVVGCVDSGATYMPAMLRSAAPAPRVETRPDVRHILTTDLAAVFLPSSAPSDISFSEPIRNNVEWSSCVRASVNGAMGRPIGMRTFRLIFDNGKVGRREAVDDSDACATQQYEKL